MNLETSQSAGNVKLSEIIGNATAGTLANKQGLIVRPQTKPRWRWTTDPQWHFQVHVARAPNWFHRLMQRWLLGIHWERI